VLLARLFSGDIIRPTQGRPQPHPSQLIILVIENAQDSQEQIEDIEIERDGGGDLLLDMIVAHDQLGIDEDISGEDEGGDGAVDELDLAIHGEEGGHKPKQDQEPQRPHQVRHPAGEVVFGLARKQGQRDEQAQRQHQRLHDNPRLVERRHHADRVGLQQREARQEEQIRRVALALPVGDQHEAERAEDRDQHQPEVGLDPEPVVVAEEGNRAECCREEDLRGSVPSFG
jgi:hypothetical protein